MKAGSCSRRGGWRETGRVLDESEAVLAGTDDYVARGNIQSAYGRIARRQGLYDRALGTSTAPSSCMYSATRSIPTWAGRG